MKTKVGLVKQHNYEFSQLKQAVKMAFDFLGGIGAVVKAGQKVLLKPNILSGRPPEDGACTHIEVIRAVIRLVKECGAVPFIGDNPGGAINQNSAYEGSLIKALAKDEDIELKYSIGVQMARGFPIASYFFECDKIISLPKMKTHSLMGITGAVKNMYGAVVGLTKAEFHRRFPNPRDFAKVLTDVFEIVKPHLVLMDGIVAMEGHGGPGAGDLRDAGILMASEDSVAIDAVFCALIGIHPLKILTTKEAYNRKLGEADLKKIEILGEKLENSILKGFKLPHQKLLLMNLPKSVTGFLADFVKFGPHIDKTSCRKCRICQDTCPVQSISIEETAQNIDYKKCIRCMCCHEVCPYKAIELKSNIIAKVFGV
jgi:uncharacterized protein (DUF362 family)/Pyruvate/2-oxoacid:ferredoxin oxidoreductase delta subunit